MVHIRFVIHHAFNINGCCFVYFMFATVCTLFILNGNITIFDCLVED